MRRRWSAALACLALARAAAAGQEGDVASFRFVVLGHLRGDKNGAMLQNLDEVASEVRRTDPDLVFLCGDLIWGDVDNPGPADRAVILADWEKLDRVLATIAAPIYRVPGNHDICDVVTRDIWRDRYGVTPRAIAFENARFLLFSSAWVPTDGDTRKHPEGFIRGQQLDDGEKGFLRDELAQSGAARPTEHFFVVMHHLLWWEDNAPWWREVHPLLVGHDVRAVFGGDYGPMKFSHLARDGIDYLQTSIENRVSLEMLRGRELSRMLSSQLDNFLLVTVTGKEVRYEVRTVGAMGTAKFTPQHWREVNEYDKGTFERRLFQRWSTPQRLFKGLLGLSGAAFAAGACAALAAFFLWRLVRGRRA